MARFDQVLNQHALLGLDTSIFIYHLENVPRYSDLTTLIFTPLIAGTARAVTSVLTLMELTVHPIQQGRPAVARGYESNLARITALSIVDVGRDTARHAAHLRATYRVGPADALQLAACLIAGATAFVTNDSRLRRIRELDIILLDDYLTAS